MFNNKGISIIGAVFTLLILAVFGAAIVALVSTDHEVRRRHIEKEQAFYEAQAGFEYAIREINQGGYPVVTAKQLGRGAFTTIINYSQHNITSTGIVGDASKMHQITYSPMGGDCINLNGTGATAGGTGDVDVGGVTVQKTCLTAVTVDKIQLSWTPNTGEKVKRIEISGTQVYDNATGLPSGSIVETTDFTIANANTIPINLMRFSSSMKNKQITMVVYLTDTSYKSSVFTAR